MNRQTQKIVADFSNHLKILGYSSSTYLEVLGILKEFSIYLKNDHRKLSFKGVSKEMVTDYIEHLKQRNHKRIEDRKLSAVHINSHILTLKRLSDYLWKTESIVLPTAHLVRLKEIRHEKPYLTVTEIKRLYKIIHPTNKIGMRDRAMLGVFYGCGLRRSEGIEIKIKDVNFSNDCIHVRNGKGNKERLVPMSKTVKNDIREYINIGRRLYLKKQQREQYLFINYRGDPIQSQSLLNRLKTLLDEADIKKNIGLHSLRHSIATHLLENNVDLEYISMFLGHSSLESTQIYTHIDEQEQQYL